MDVTVSDSELVRRVLDGDTPAYALLVNRYRERYVRFAAHMLGSADDAEEVVQDTFVRAYAALGRYEEREQFRAWLFRILVNRCRTAGGRLRRRARTFIAHERTLHAAPAAEEDDGAWRDEIHRALAQLPPEQREAFLLKHVEELSYEEMMAITGASLSALKMRVNRACRRLRELLQEVYHA